jgi:acetoin utilization deacetylase AcuC-like enzyme
MCAQRNGRSWPFANGLLPNSGIEAVETPFRYPPCALEVVASCCEMRTERRSITAYFDPRQLCHEPTLELHNGGWADYAEKPSRAEIILSEFETWQPTSDHGLDAILRVHCPDYVEFLQVAHRDWSAAGREGDAIGYAWPIVHRRNLDLSRIDARLGRFSYDAVTPITAGTWQSAYWSAQSALSALDAVIGEGRQCAFALCRPPGHHAGRDYLGGYCYLNSAAIAAAEATHQGRRVSILDVDYHHGNGTQDIFYDSAEVLFASIHADPAMDYPFYWGHADERGEGAGLGKTVNLPLPRGTRLDAYLEALDTACAAVRAHGTDLLVLSFGADTFEHDPISHFKLREGDFAVIGSRISALKIPTVVVMEGGYAIDALGHNVSSLLSGFSSS